MRGLYLILNQKDWKIYTSKLRKLERRCHQIRDTFISCSEVSKEIFCYQETRQIHKRGFDLGSVASRDTRFMRRSSNSMTKSNRILVQNMWEKWEETFMASRANSPSTTYRSLVRSICGHSFLTGTCTTQFLSVSLIKATFSVNAHTTIRPSKSAAKKN